MRYRGDGLFGHLDPAQRAIPESTTSTEVYTMDYNEELEEELTEQDLDRVAESIQDGADSDEAETLPSGSDTPSTDSDEELVEKEPLNVDRSVSLEL